MPANEATKIKSTAISLVMKNPEFSRLISDAWEAPVGSTKRQKAKAVLSLLGKVQGRAPSPMPEQELKDTNPWVSLPAYKPTLHYAKPLPRRGQPQLADGKGGSGQAQSTIGSFDQSGRFNPDPLPPIQGPSSAPLWKPMPLPAIGSFTSTQAFPPPKTASGAGFAGGSGTSWGEPSLSQTQGPQQGIQPIAPGGVQEQPPSPAGFASSEGPFYGPAEEGVWSTFPDSGYAPGGDVSGMGSYAQMSTDPMYNINAIQGLDVTGAASGMSQSAYEAKALQTISQMSDAEWSKNFPGIPRPRGMDLVGHTQSLIDAKRKELGLDNMLQQLRETQDENSNFVMDARDYIVAQDQHLKEIDRLLDDAETKAITMPTDAPVFAQMMGNYTNYLRMMKGKVVKRYGDYVNNAIGIQNQKATRLQNEVDTAQQELQMALPLLQAKGEQDYGRILKMIDENWQKPAQAASAYQDAQKAEMENLKINLELIKLQKEATGTNTDDYYKTLQNVTTTISDPKSGAVNPYFLDIRSTLSNFADSPAAVYDAYGRVMASTLASEQPEGSNRSKGDVLLDYGNSIGSLYQDLQNERASLLQTDVSKLTSEQKSMVALRIEDINAQIGQLSKSQSVLIDPTRNWMTGMLAGTDQNNPTSGSAFNKIKNYFNRVSTSGSLWWKKPSDFSFTDSQKQEFLNSAEGKELSASDKRLPEIVWNTMKANASDGTGKYDIQAILNGVSNPDPSFEIKPLDANSFADMAAGYLTSYVFGNTATTQ